MSFLSPLCMNSTIPVSRVPLSRLRHVCDRQATTILRAISASIKALPLNDQCDRKTDCSVRPAHRPAPISHSRQPPHRQVDGAMSCRLHRTD
ncbi:unnamed protein product [Protopolystoma xenopodis]|uniref:Uncharacterized protein n=1 Tax=Protopolystoma xenopodis TaxID=117903 RepID=A0A3S5AQY8_9PLAT|nr:unnamed protein product [Protopolystoma xenopodis]